MSPDSISQISLGTAVLILFGLCAGFVLLRGMLRMAIGMLVVGGSLALGWWVWREAPVWIFETVGNVPSWAPPALAAAVFLLSWLLLAKLVRFVVSPGSPPKATLTGLIGRLVFALVPTAMLAFAATAVFQHIPHETGSAATFPARVTAWLESAIPKDWLETLDPLAHQARVELAQTITRQADPPRAAVVDPKTGKPIPRAVIVQDPELQNLAREGKFSTLLRHPSLTKALADPQIQKLLR